MHELPCLVKFFGRKHEYLRVFLRRGLHGNACGRAGVRVFGDFHCCSHPSARYSESDSACRNLNA